MAPTRSNSPGSTQYDVPSAVLDLLENQLGCVTAGHAAHGLRWERNGIGVVFFEYPRAINTAKSVNIYMLPTGIKPWKTEKVVQDVLAHAGCLHLAESVRVLERGKHIRIRNVSWGDVLKVLPVLIPWSLRQEVTA